MTRPDLKGDDYANNDDTYLGWVSYWLIVHGETNNYLRCGNLEGYIRDRTGEGDE